MREKLILASQGFIKKCHKKFTNSYYGLYVAFCYNGVFYEIYMSKGHDTKGSEKEPITTRSVLAVAPKVFAPGFSAFLGTWFAMDQYAESLPFSNHLRGLGGKKLIFSDLHFLSDIKSIVAKWKSDGNKKDGTRLHPTEEVVGRIIKVAEKYGLDKEAAFVRDWLQNNPTLANDAADSKSREALRVALGEAKERFPFFGLFHPALGVHNDGTLSTSKALLKVEEHVEEIFHFRRNHHLSVLNVYRIPATAAVVAATVGLVGWEFLREKRKENSFAARLERMEKEKELESSPAKG